jgi:hypothetical protein
MNRAHRIASAIALVALAASVTAGMALAHHGGIEGLFNARGTLDPVALHDRDSKLKIKVKEPVDVAIVGAQIHAHGQTGWHTHPTDSIVSVHLDAPTLTMVTHERGRCVEQTFEGGEAFVHPAGPHNFLNDSELPLNFGVAYFVPVGAQLLTAAPRPVGCR